MILTQLFQKINVFFYVLIDSLNFRRILQTFITLFRVILFKLDTLWYEDEWKKMYDPIYIYRSIKSVKDSYFIPFQHLSFQASSAVSIQRIFKLFLECFLLVRPWCFFRLIVPTCINLQKFDKLLNKSLTWSFSRLIFCSTLHSSPVLSIFLLYTYTRFVTFTF